MVFSYGVFTPLIVADVSVKNASANLAKAFELALPTVLSFL